MMRLSLPAGFAMLAITLASPAVAGDGYVNPLHFPQPESSGEFFALIEIPSGSSIKYEIDADTGHVFVDRFLSMPVAYPANYGSIPSSAGADGDPLDALVLSREAIAPGVLIKVRAIGLLSMIDDGDADDKIIAVPTSAIDPSYDSIQSIDDLPLIERNRILSFFRVYKQLPDPADSERVELDGFRNAEDARKRVTAAIEAYRESAED